MMQIYRRDDFKSPHNEEFWRLGAFARKLKGFCGLFFRCINKTRNLHEVRKVYSECFVFRGVFRKNFREIPAKCELRKKHP